MRLYGEMHRFLPAYASLVGAHITEIEVVHHPRIFGVSKYGISRTFRVLLDLMMIKFLSAYRTRPLHAFGLAGLLTLLLGGASSAVVLGVNVANRKTIRLQQDARPAKRTAVQNTTGWLLLNFGFQYILLGIIAELLTRTYHESQNKPIYVIKEEL